MLHMYVMFAMLQCCPPSSLSSQRTMRAIAKLPTPLSPGVHNVRNVHNLHIARNCNVARRLSLSQLCAVADNHFPFPPQPLQGFQEGLSGWRVDRGGFHQDLHPGDFSLFKLILLPKSCVTKSFADMKYALRACKFRLVVSPT